MHHRRTLFSHLLLVLFVAALVAGFPPGRLQAEEVPVWQAAETIRGLAFEAQKELLAAGGADDSAAHYATAAAQIEQAGELYRATLQPDLQTHASDADQAIEGALEAAYRAALGGNRPALSGARGRLWTAMLWGSYEVTGAAITAGDPDLARAWLRLREYRRATRVSVVESYAVEALDAWKHGEAGPEATRELVLGDLRDSYFFRLRDALDHLQEAVDKGYASRAAEWASQARGYYAILEADFGASQGETAAASLEATLAALEEAVLLQDWDAVARHISETRAQIASYEPVALSAEDIARRSQLLYLFIDLVYVEYKDGVRNGEITIETEYLEAVTFRDQAEVVFEELRPRIAETDPEAAVRLAELLGEMNVVMGELGDKQLIQAQTEEALAIVEATLGEQAVSDDLSATFDVIDSLLDEMMVHARNGDYALAERTRIQAYALFDAGPELRLLGVSPELAARIDGLFWQGYRRQPGFGQLIPLEAPYADLKALRGEMDQALDEAEQTLSAGVSPLAIVTNAAIIVFREGLESVVILVALLASLAKGANRAYRRPLVAGAVLAFAATIATWALARQLLLSLARFGERLEAVVSLVAVGVLLLITNWFFHKIYWKDWLAQFHKIKGSLIRANVGQTLGLVALGFTSIYREGFETVLFLQALVLEAGPLVVLQGVVLGLLAVAIVGVVTFALQRRLPYMHMMVFTGVLIGLVLVTMVGNTLHVMQAVGWLPITPVPGFSPPHDLGLWFGVFPTWQTLLGQGAAAAFVVGSYYLAEHQKRRARQRDGGLNQPVVAPEQV